MAISLMPLPYARTALEPAISAETLDLHHGKHHKGYVDKTNALIENTDLAEASLNTIVLQTDARQNPKLYNQAAQAWNHGFYWNSLSPTASQPGPALADAIERAFGSQDKLLEALAKEAEEHFGSGWAWLMAEGDVLSIAATHDAACPLGQAARPLLVIDVWEHAYYLDRKNDRKAYVAAALGLLNWSFAEANFTGDEAWTYPD